VIGPKCIHCKKQLLHHNKAKACPVGKRHRLIGFTQFSSTTKFEGKEPKHQRGSESRKDYNVRKETKAEPCCACGTRGTDWNPVDPAHLRTWNVTQSDHPSAMIPLCRECHKLQHREGWDYMISAFPGVAQAIDERDWTVTPHPFQKGKLILTHPEIK